jgi:isorenieratene synthase
MQASPARIQRALDHALSLPSGGWYVVGATRTLGAAPTRHLIAGHELVSWRGPDGAVRLAPIECPHLGADLSRGRVEHGKLVCPWHGLQLCDTRHGRWAPAKVHDDGVLTWVRLAAPDEPMTDAPIIAPRPTSFLDAVIRLEADCEPSDILANRLDPWHGAWFHPHSFGRLRVLEESVDAIVVRVSFRVLGPLAVEVDARFHCPEPRTIVMTILDGEGKGSVVETHATPVGPGHTAVIEATLATSERQGFAHALGAMALIRPLMETRARRLWIEDTAYAERTYAVRTRAREAPLTPAASLVGRSTRRGPLRPPID